MPARIMISRTYYTQIFDEYIHPSKLAIFLIQRETIKSILNKLETDGKSVEW